MFRTLALCATIVVALLCAPLDAAARTKPGSAPPAGDRYIVLYHSAVPSADAETDRQERARGFRARHRFRHAVEGFAARLDPEQVRGLRADPDVAFVTPDRPVHALGQVPLASGEPLPPPGIRRIGAATSNSAREASGTGVAVIDTGVDLSHPDLNAVGGVNCVTPGAAPTDENGHGTHVAGTIGARNNGAGVVGVAPATKIYAVKVLDAAGDGSWSSIICGLDWVTANAAALNIKVANMSLGGLGSNDNDCGATDGDALHAAVCRLTRTGVLSVVAAGNDGWNLGDTPPDVPAAYPEVLTVTAMADSDGTGGAAGPAPACRAGEADDARATFSNYATRPGDRAHMVAAPGVCITSTAPGGGYATMSGTSMASPHVAGAAALCLSEGGTAGPCSGMTPAQIVERVRADAAAHATANPAQGFAGDPEHPNAFADYYGNLARVAPDRTAPQTTIASGPSGATRSASATFAFSASEPGSRFECRVDGGAWAGCSSPHTVAALADGAHWFEARATDMAGNADATPARRDFAVDTTAPDTHIASGPAGTTKNATPTFEFTSPEAGARFECRVDTGAWAACTSPHRTSALANGAHTFQVRALDALGNADATPGSQTFTVDTVTLAPPRASSGDASEVGETTAGVGGTVVPNGQATTYRFEYGTTAGYGFATPEVSAGAGGEPVPVRSTVSGLSAATTYHYRVVATNPAGTTFGEDRSFTTASPPPQGTAPASSEPPAGSGTPPAPVPPAPPAPAPAPPAPAPAPPAPAPDTLRPAVSLTVPSQRLRTVFSRGLRASFGSSEPARVSARLLLDATTAKRLRIARGAATLATTSAAPTTKRTLVLKLSSRTRARLRGVRTLRVTLRVVATDAAGNARSVDRRITLRA